MFTIKKIFDLFYQKIELRKTQQIFMKNTSCIMHTNKLSMLPIEHSNKRIIIKK